MGLFDFLKNKKDEPQGEAAAEQQAPAELQQTSAAEQQETTELQQTLTAEQQAPVPAETQTADSAPGNSRFSFMAEEISPLQNQPEVAVVTGNIHGRIEVGDVAYLLAPHSSDAPVSVTIQDIALQDGDETIAAQSAQDQPVRLLLNRKPADIAKFSVLSNVQPQLQMGKIPVIENPVTAGLLYEAKRFPEDKKFWDCLAFSLVRMHFVVPMLANQPPRDNGDGTATFDAGASVSFYTLENPNDKTDKVLLSFTNWDEWNAWKDTMADKGIGMIVMRFPNVVSIIQSNSYHGLIINPSSENRGLITGALIQRIVRSDGYQQQFGKADGQAPASPAAPAAGSSRRFFFMAQDAYAFGGTETRIVGNLHGSAQIGDPVFILNGGTSKSATINALYTVTEDGLNTAETVQDGNVCIQLALSPDDVKRFSIITNVQPLFQTEGGIQVENPALAGLLYEEPQFRGDQHYYGFLAFALAHAHFIAPTQVDPNAQKGDTIKQGNGLRLYSLTNSEDKSKVLLPLYTDRIAFRSWETKAENTKGIVLPFQDVAAMLNAGTFTGFVLNLHCKNQLFIGKEFVDTLVKTSGYQQEFGKK